MKTVTLELPEEVYAAVTQSAQAQRQPLSLWLANQLSGRVPREVPLLSAEERAAAWARLEQHSGAQSLGYPTGADNESIDADLAREYGNTHEDGA